VRSGKLQPSKITENTIYLAISSLFADTKKDSTLSSIKEDFSTMFVTLARNSD